MKRAIRSSENIYAMSIINPQLCKRSSIQIEIEQRDEGPIPHLHVYLDKARNPKNCAYVRLDKAEYAPHHQSTKMSRSQKKEFIDIMTSVWPKSFVESVVSGEIKKATGYESAVSIWIDTFGETVQFQYTDEGYPLMPDYNNL